MQCRVSPLYLKYQVCLALEDLWLHIPAKFCWSLWRRHLMLWVRWDGENRWFHSRTCSRQRTKRISSHWASANLKAWMDWGTVQARNGSGGHYIKQLFTWLWHNWRNVLEPSSKPWMGVGNGPSQNSPLISWGQIERRFAGKEGLITKPEVFSGVEWLAEIRELEQNFDELGQYFGWISTKIAVYYAITLIPSELGLKTEKNTEQNPASLLGGGQ